MATSTSTSTRSTEMRGNAKRKQVKKIDQMSRRQAAVALAVEGLENRTMLAAQPVLYYHFNSPPDSGGTITNDGVGGATYTGTFGPTGATPTATVRNNTAGHTTEAAAIAMNGIDNVIETAQPLQPVMGKTATLAAWVKTPANQAGNGSAWLAYGLSGIEDGGGSNDIFWGIVDAGGLIGVQAGNGAWVKSTSRVNDGNWHHVLMSRDMANGQVRIFVDGNLQTTGTSATGEQANPALNASLGAGLFKTIGAVEDDAGVGSRDEWPGEIDEVMVFDRVLTTAEARA